MTSLQQTAMLGGAASAKTASYTLVAADAGTAISMSNASATTITVNTALFAAGDTVQITNLGVGVCTITAGTATVNTASSLALAQYESGTLDFTSTSAAIFIKGDGAAAASGGMTLINSGGTTLTGASVAITSIPNTYKDLRLVVRNFKPVTASDHLSVYVNNDTNSRYNRWPVSDPSTNGNTSQSWAESSWAYVSPAGETTLFQGTAIFNIFDYANTSTWKLGQMYAINNNVGTPANVNFMQQLIYYNQVTAISSIYLKTTGGDFSSGTAFLYGVS